MHMRAHDVHRVLMRIIQGQKPRGGSLLWVTSRICDVSLRVFVRFPGDDQAVCEVTGKSKHIMCQCKTECRKKRVGPKRCKPAGHPRCATSGCARAGALSVRGKRAGFEVVVKNSRERGNLPCNDSASAGALWASFGQQVLNRTIVYSQVGDNINVLGAGSQDRTRLSTHSNVILRPLASGGPAGAKLLIRLRPWRMSHHSINVNRLRRDKRGAKRIRNLISRWHSLPPEAVFWS
ncbi:hypothetical protein SAMN05216233_111116 [Desulfoluna spongiiphila]|uniref:Uncharacterized protein n=1 Tax=Desulfoluna spongiiphila TaxID=419481 RepID=A0A1G5GU17_9BACT|nr:hypothetical protein SAMN05216233_111116 [Desulfoluna spongiiphila]